MPEERTCSKCRSTKYLSEFSADRARGSGQRYCRSCVQSASNPTVNAVSRLAGRMAGGRRAYSALPKAQRLALRERAAQIHALGAEVGQAAARSASRIPSGFVYIILNDAFPGRVKIGSAVDAESRLGDAQTWDPNRGFYIAHTVFLPDRNAGERRIHDQLRAYRTEGEWFAVPLSQARAALDREACQTLPVEERHPTERTNP